MSEDEAIRLSVERHGWHAISVEESELSPSFLYSIGLVTSWSHPEVITFGLPRDTAYAVVANLVNQLRLGRSYADKGVHTGLLDDLEVWVRPVHESQLGRYFGYAIGYYRHLGRSEDLRAVQVFWPDSSGRLPNDIRCDPLVASAQPRLEIPRASSD
jgi:hypothetical protein